MIIYVLIIIFILPIIVNLILIYLSLHQDVMNVVEGELLTKKIERKTYPTKMPSSEEPTVISMYLIKIKYKYFVNGRAYKSSRVNYELFDTQYNDEIIANDVLSKINNDGKIIVYYNRFFPFIPIVQKSKPQISMNVFVIILCTALIAGLIIFVKLV